MSSNYRVPVGLLSQSEEVKKSRFLTYLRHVSGKEAVREWLVAMRHEHPAARHLCWACVAAAPWDSQSYGFCDDGEPSGTAGKPLLNLLLGSGLGEIAIVVVRYYGGIKLGTGGLVRAYSYGASELLSSVATRLVVASQPFSLCCSYEELPLCQWLMEQFVCESVAYSYEEQVCVTGLCPLTVQEDFILAVRNRSHGRIRVSWFEDK
ncbi:MAG: YigZ family protein [Aeromonadaceae bacterium]